MKHLTWLKLKSVPGIGNILFKRLLDRFGDPDSVFKSSMAELTTVYGISDRIARNIKTHKTPDSLLKDTEVALNNGIKIVVMNDEEYPYLLREIPDPPPILMVWGVIPTLPAIAVVGSRNASSYGLTNARRMASDLVKCGASVISGLARGIDTSAHEGALSSRGKTVAVLGSGLGHIYPKENKKLAAQISENGAVISEFLYTSVPDAKNFPIRNRIISGMALGTLVVEASDKSGSLITARLAVEQNREVFAIPGSIQSMKSTGTHGLLKQGAKLVESAKDIVEEIPDLSFKSVISVQKIEKFDLETIKNKFNLDFNELSVLKVLDSYPVHIDDIIQKTNIEPGKLSGILLKLELSGFVIQSPGKMFSINEEVL